MKRIILIVLSVFLFANCAYADIMGGVSDVDNIKEIGSATAGRAVTDTLYVDENGNNSNGKTWDNAYNNLQTALDAASTDANDCTLILISPHTSSYNINTTGDPTWSGNYILKGSRRNWTKIVNNHASATSVMKFTGYVTLSELTIDCGTATNNGVIITGDGARACDVYFEGENITGAHTMLELSGSAEYAHMDNVMFHGVVAYTTGLLVENYKLSNISWLDFHDCLVGMKITNTSPDNVFSHLLFHENTLGMDIDGGTNQFFHEIAFAGCDRNVDDEVDSHSWLSIHGAFDITVTPNNFTGFTVTTNAGADTWGNDIELIPTGSIDNPFRIVASQSESDANEKFRIRFSADGGVTHFSDIQVEGVANQVKRESDAHPSGTEFIFNKGTRISASSKCESGGGSSQVWLEIQEF